MHRHTQSHTYVTHNSWRTAVRFKLMRVQAAAAAVMDFFFSLSVSHHLPHIHSILVKSSVD